MVTLLKKREMAVNVWFLNGSFNTFRYSAVRPAKNMDLRKVKNEDKLELCRKYYLGTSKFTVIFP